jgi:nicotinate-nucleotide adenylyltransferase
LKRIGLFGGSFDPVHNAHVALARSALDDLTLDELRWIPAGRPWQKSRVLAAAEHRAAMVALAIEGEPRFVLDEIELHRAGPSYTLDTVDALQAQHPAAQWVLVIGQDQFVALPSWQGVAELLERVTLAVARRLGSPAVTLPGHVQVIDLPPMPHSSTEVRARLAAGQPITDLVPSRVASYIDSHRLYR